MALISSLNFGKTGQNKETGKVIFPLEVENLFPQPTKAGNRFDSNDHPEKQLNY